MDTLYWTGLNPKISFLETSKAMYGKYLYRLTVIVDGACILRDPTADIVKEVSNRNLAARSMNYGGSWRTVKRVSVDAIPLLEKIRTARENHSDIKCRIEQDIVHFYASDENELIKLSKDILYQDNDHFQFMMKPRNKTVADAMLDGKVLRKTKPEYSHRMVMRDGRYSEETKQNLLSWIDSMGDMVKIPRSLRDNLEKLKHGYIWGGYIYANDPRLYVMVNMIDPKLVTRIEEFYEV